MRILAVAATAQEIPLLQSCLRGHHHLDVLVTGIGMVATAAHCGRAMARRRYDLAFNFGVCGTFDSALALGTVVHVTTDQLSELGVEDGERFVPLDQLGLAATTVVSNPAPPVNSVLARLPVVRGITVSTAHGHAPTIAAAVARFNPAVESMEGAAFAYACAMSQVPYAQVRAISNVIEPRNRDAWRMDLAIRNLNETALEILDHA